MARKRPKRCLRRRQPLRVVPGREPAAERRSVASSDRSESARQNCRASCRGTARDTAPEARWLRRSPAAVDPPSRVALRRDKARRASQTLAAGCCVKSICCRSDRRSRRKKGGAFFGSVSCAAELWGDCSFRECVLRGRRIFSFSGVCLARRSICVCSTVELALRGEIAVSPRPLCSVRRSIQRKISWRKVLLSGRCRSLSNFCRKIRQKFPQTPGASLISARLRSKAARSAGFYPADSSRMRSRP